MMKHALVFTLFCVTALAEVPPKLPHDGLPGEEPRKVETEKPRIPSLINLGEEDRVHTPELSTQGKAQHFFKDYLFADDKVILFGDGMTALLICQKRGESTLTITQGKHIRLSGEIVDPADRRYRFQDADLCAKSTTAIRSLGRDQLKLMAVETQGDQINRFDIR